MLNLTNLTGAIVADVYFATCILIFVFRLLGKPQISHAVGYLQMLLALPLVYLIWQAPGLERPVLYFIQTGLMLAFILVETLLDYVLRVEFRKVRWSVISYVVFFFAATGGMVGVAANAGLIWKISAVALFLIMGVLAFVQRARTGL
jgi:hypothetical protein